MARIEKAVAPPARSCTPGIRQGRPRKFIRGRPRSFTRGKLLRSGAYIYFTANVKPVRNRVGQFPRIAFLGSWPKQEIGLPTRPDSLLPCGNLLFQFFKPVQHHVDLRRCRLLLAGLGAASKFTCGPIRAPAASGKSRRKVARSQCGTRTGGSCFTAAGTR